AVRTRACSSRIIDVIFINIFVVYCMHFAFLFFFLWLRRPRRSPLFPYTTLFRSHSGRREKRPGEVRTPGSRDHVRSCVERNLQSDRKSTRLNSSHVSISYAVFCLKKKTITRHYQWPRQLERNGLRAYEVVVYYDT